VGCRAPAPRSVSTAFLLLLPIAASAAPGVLVRTGDPSPLGLPFSRFSDPALDQRGRVAFVGGAAVVFRRTAGGLAHVVGAGDGLAGHTVAGVGPPALGAQGCLAFRAEFVGGGGAIFRRCGETAEALAAVGDPAPRGGTLGILGGSLVLGAGGRVAFSAVLDDGTVALLAADGGGPAVEVARVGAPAPTGGTFTSFRLVGVAADGSVGFRGAVSGGRDGLFAWSAGVLAARAVVGDATPAGGRFTTLGGASLNDDGRWVFRGTAALPDGSMSGIFLADASQPVVRLDAIALEHQPTPLGGVFRSFPSSVTPAIAPDGTVVFRATVQGAAFPSGVFLRTRAGDLVTVVAAGQSTAVGSLLRLRDPGLAADGSVVLGATLRDGTPGLFRVVSGEVRALAILGEATDLGGGFRFTDASVRDTADDAAFLGLREGVFVAAPGRSLRTLAALGDPAPRGGRFAGFDPPAGGGPVVLGASIAGGRRARALVRVGARGAVTLVVAGDRALGARVVDFFSDPLDALERAGVGPGGVAFQAALDRGTVPTGLFLVTGRGLRPVAHAGGAAPGGGRYVAFGTPAVHRAGEVVFVAQLRAGVGDQALCLRKRRRTSILAATGRETGTRLGGRFVSFDTPAAGAGTVVFGATVDPGKRQALFVAHGRDLRALAATGEPAPTGGRFRDFAAPVVAGRGVVFRAEALEATRKSGMYRIVPGPSAGRDGPAAVEALVVSGGTSPLGGVFLAFGAPSGNRRGAIAFTAELLGAGASAAVLLEPS
jgi:hypothetical protein